MADLIILDVLVRDACSKRSKLRKLVFPATDFTMTENCGAITIDVNPSGSVLARNGLSVDTGYVEMGGALVNATTITTTGANSLTISGDASTLPTNGALLISGGLGVSGEGNFGSSVTTQTSQEASLGSELIANVVDRNFTGAPNWTDGGGAWTLGSGRWNRGVSALGTTLDMAFLTTPLVLGNYYRATFSGSSTSPGSGGITVGYGLSTKVVSIPTISGPFSVNVIFQYNSAGAPTVLSITPNATWDGYIDNITLKEVGVASSVLNFKNSSGTEVAEVRVPTTNSIGIGENSLQFSTGDWNTFLGSSAGASLTSGYNNVGIGYNVFSNSSGLIEGVAIGSNALLSTQSGSGDVAVGFSALRSAMNSSYNVAVGRQAMYFFINNSSVGGAGNTSIGNNSSFGLERGSGNVAIGHSTFLNTESGDDNVAIGHFALGQETGTHERNVAIGAYAGMYESGSDAFYINNQNRTNTVGDKTLSLMYGNFAPLATNQKLTINGQVNASVIQEFADNAAAVTGGLVIGDIYRTGDLLKIVH